MRFACVLLFLSELGSERGGMHDLSCLLKGKDEKRKSVFLRVSNAWEWGVGGIDHMNSFFVLFLIVFEEANGRSNCIHFCTASYLFPSSRPFHGLFSHLSPAYLPCLLFFAGERDGT